jgi:nicotinamidase-related amidase
MERNSGATDLERWGLVVVDMQNDFLATAGYYDRRRDLDALIGRGVMTTETRNRLLSQPGTAPSGGFTYRSEALPRIVANIVAVIEQARAAHRPIAYLKAVYSREFDVQPPFLRREPDRAHYPCRPHTWGTAFIGPLHRLTAAAQPASRERVITKHTVDGLCRTELLRFLRDMNVQSVVIVGVETHVCVLTTAQSASINHFTTIILEDCVWTANEPLGQAALAIFRDAFGSTARCDDFLHHVARHAS